VVTSTQQIQVEEIQTREVPGGSKQEWFKN